MSFGVGVAKVGNAARRRACSPRLAIREPALLLTLLTAFAMVPSFNNHQGQIRKTHIHFAGTSSHDCVQAYFLWVLYDVYKVKLENVFRLSLLILYMSRLR